jgi:hypothetical protein
MNDDATADVPVTAEIVSRVNDALHRQRQRVIWDATRGADGCWVLVDLQICQPVNVLRLAAQLRCLPARP